MIDRYGGYTQACIFSGVCCLVGSLLVFVDKLLLNRNVFAKV